MKSSDLSPPCACRPGTLSAFLSTLFAWRICHGGVRGAWRLHDSVDPWCGSGPAVGLCCTMASWNPLKNMNHLGISCPIYGKIKNVPNHQPGDLWRILIDFDLLSAKICLRCLCGSASLGSNLIHTDVPHAWGPKNGIQLIRVSLRMSLRNTSFDWT